MTVIYLILGFGGLMGLIAVAVASIVDRMAARKRALAGPSHIPKDPAAQAGLNPGAMMARWGADKPAHHSLDVVVLRPTIGIKVFGIAIVGLMLFVMSGTSGEMYRNDPIIVGLVTAATIYLGLMLSLYEVRYDAETVTAPGWFFRPKTYDWVDFISISQSDQVTYTLIFNGGKLKVRKFLVGMPTFLTFVTEVREMNKGR